MRRFFIVTITLLLAVSFVAAGFYYITYSQYWMQAHDIGSTQSLEEITIAKGASSKRIIDDLHKAGIISSPTIFRLYATLEGDARSYKAGEYQFSASYTPREVSKQLVKGANVVRSVTIVEGWLSQQVVEELNSANRLTGRIGAVPPQGSLLPETYFYMTGDSRQNMLAMMQQKMNDVLDAAWKMRQPGLPIKTKQEALILASVVEKETGSNSEERHVASVFINRLRKGMKLQSDPTANYGLYLKTGELKTRMMLKDVRDVSAYNTYIINGLPPKPICNPGRASIEAVMNPISTKDLYFVADGEGGHIFAATLSQHNRNVAAYRKKMRDMR